MCYRQLKYSSSCILTSLCRPVTGSFQPATAHMFASKESAFVVPDHIAHAAQRLLSSSVAAETWPIHLLLEHEELATRKLLSSCSCSWNVANPLVAGSVQRALQQLLKCQKHAVLICCSHALAADTWQLRCLQVPNKMALNSMMPQNCFCYPVAADIQQMWWSQVLFKGTCNGCWNVRSTLQSECGKCKVGACKACQDKWAQQRQHGKHANEAGLYVPQANVCFCGAHLTPRGAAAYSRKVDLHLLLLVSAALTYTLLPTCRPYSHK